MSFDQPITTGRIIGLGAAYLLEAIRTVDRGIRCYQVSTPRRSAGSSRSRRPKRRPFYPRSPYGVAKLFARRLTVNYRESFGIFGVSGILFNHGSPLRGREFVMRKITDTVAKIALGTATHLELGNLDAKREWGFARDYVEGLRLMLQADVADTYVLATNRTETVRSFVELAFRHIDVDIDWSGSDADEIGTDRRTGKLFVRVNSDFYRPAGSICLLAISPTRASNWAGRRRTRGAGWVDDGGRPASQRDRAVVLTAIEREVPVRVHEIDGIRGWAALMVVFFHLTYETFGAVIPLFRSPAFAIANGQLAVAVFFVLSGDALSMPYLTTGRERSLVALALRRHSRLTIPVLASVLLFGILSKLHLVYNFEAAKIVNRMDWLGSAGKPFSGFLHGIAYSIVGMYEGPAADFSTNPFTWTMSIEFIGSFVVFATIPMIKHLREPMLVLMVAMFICLFAVNTSFIADFIAGILFAHLRCVRTLALWRKNRAVQVVSLVVITACFVAAAYCQIYGYVRITSALAVVLTWSIYCNVFITRGFASRISQLLGRVSFSVYLVQWSVIVSFTSFCILRFGQPALTVPKAMAIALASLVVVIVAAIVFEPVELLTRRVGKLVSERILNLQDLRSLKSVA